MEDDGFHDITLLQAIHPGSSRCMLCEERCNRLLGATFCALYQRLSCKRMLGRMARVFVQMCCCRSCTWALAAACCARSSAIIFWEGVSSVSIGSSCMGPDAMRLACSGLLLEAQAPGSTEASLRLLVQSSPLPLDAAFHSSPVGRHPCTGRSVWLGQIEWILKHTSLHQHAS